MERRHFLKSASLGAAAAGLPLGSPSSVANGAPADSLSAVCCHDPH